MSQRGLALALLFIIQGKRGVINSDTFASVFGVMLEVVKKKKRKKILLFLKWYFNVTLNNSKH